MFYFFFQLYNSLWVLACSIIPFHFFLSCVLCFQLVTPIFLKSFLTSSSHLTLGLPFSLVAYGFHMYMVLATLSLVILSTRPNQLSHLYFMYLTIWNGILLVANQTTYLYQNDRYWNTDYNWVLEILKDINSTRCELYRQINVLKKMY